jgi:hypothetical protein
MGELDEKPTKNQILQARLGVIHETLPTALAYLVLRLALVVLACIIASAQPVADDHWVGTWASAAVEADSKGNFHNVTLRQIVHTSVGGSRVRVQLSNEFGTQPLRIEDVHIAQRGSGSSIIPATDRHLRFGGKLFAIVPTGAAITSDAIVYDVPPFHGLGHQLLPAFY